MKRSEVEEMVRNFVADNNVEAVYGKDTEGLFIVHFLVDEEDETLELRARDHIEEAVNQWLPYLTLDDCKVTSTFTEIDNCILHIELVFHLNSDPNAYESITFDVDSFHNY